MSEKVFLSLGSNLGNREANLVASISAMETYYEISDIQSASYYETPPLVNTDQPKFLNTVIGLKTDFTPFELLDTTRKIETMLGRSPQREKNQPRTIDIDILVFGTSVIETAELIIPHPEIPFRRFVLVPFNEIAPDTIIPGINKNVSFLLEHCPDQSIIHKYQIKTQA